MAFQSDNVFSDFLRQTARNPDVSESAPAVNFLLDERVPDQRETGFLAKSPSATGSGWNSNSLKSTFGNHFAAHIGVPANKAKRCDTFDAINQPNFLPDTEPNQDVVRLESVAGFYHLAQKAGFDSLESLVTALRDVIANRGKQRDANKKQSELQIWLADNKQSQLQIWLEELNRQRDARPVFVTPFSEIESILHLPDWATQVRNMLGLAHLFGEPNKPLPVVLMRYSLSRAEQSSRNMKLNGWVVTPTVLEAGNDKGPSLAFSPFPKSAAGSNGYGATVSLGSGDGLDFKPELLHFRFDYTLEDFWILGEIKDVIEEPLLLAARRRHFAILEADFCFRKDVP